MQTNWNNFYERFAATAGRFGSLVAVESVHRDSVETITYGELRKRAEAAARFLIARDIRAGDRCAILADNDIAWCAAYLGILQIGAIAVPFDTHYAPQQIAKLLQDSGAKIIFTTERYAAGVEAACGQASTSVKLALLCGSHNRFESLSECPPLSKEPLLPCMLTLNDPAAILYTSGTTSDPKGVVLTHGNLLAEAEAVFARLKLDENDSILGVMPLYHSLAQLANLLLPFLVGARVIYLEEINASEMLRALRERQPTLFCCVPQFFYLIHQRVLSKVAEGGWMRSMLFRLLLHTNSATRRVAGLNLGGIFFSPVHNAVGKKMRLLVTGGARFDPVVGSDFYKMGFNLLEAYGLTETCGAATMTGFGEGGQGFVGKALPGVEVKIMPVDSEGGNEDSSGEIAIRGPIVMKGYFQRPDATMDVMKNEWFLTGDLGRLDGEGRLSITGRKKEVIVLSSGKNIYPEEIEAQYAQSPFIQEICVVGMALPGEPAAERLHAVIVPNLDVMRERKVVNMKEVLRFDIENISVHLPAHKRILSYRIRMEPLPRTTTRKLKRFEIEQQIKARRAEVSVSETPSQQISEEEAAWAADPQVRRAVEVIREAAHHKEAVRPEANLELDLGLDSIERVELLTNLESLFGTRMAPEVAQSIYTVRQLVEAVRSRGSAGMQERARGAWSKLLDELPDRDSLFLDLLKPHRIVTLVGFGVLKVANLFARLLVRFEVTGAENIPKDGTYLICPNHETYIDPFFLASALPYRVFRRLFYVGASEYFATPLRRKAAQWMHLAPVDPDANLIRALQAGAFGLRHGKILVLFPEGERSINGEIRKFKKGAAILSSHLKVPIVPVAFDGVFPIWPRNRELSWRALLPWSSTRVRLHFGAPMQPGHLPETGCSSAGAEEHYATVTEQLRQNVIRMQAALRDSSGSRNHSCQGT